MELVSGSPDETSSLGQAISHHLRPGDLVIMVGDLGSGKSVFIRGMARGMGVEGNIPSPTFILLRDYPEQNFSHIDAYRLESWEELSVLGIEDYLYGDRICAVEWGDRITGALPRDFLEVRIGFMGSDDSSRVLKFVPHGVWKTRWPVLREELNR